MIDIGVNLADRAFDGDRSAVVERARAAGVAGLVITGTTVAQSRAARELAARWPGFAWSTAGVHPHHAAECDAATLPALRELTAEPEVVAIGETGLDFFRDLSPRPVQVDWFRRQLGLAAELGLPAFLHERDASDAFAGVVAELRPRLARAVVHCFTAGPAALRRYLDLDLYVGITGWICDERRGTELRELVRLIPDDRLLLETDAPYLLPRTLEPRPKTRRNEPAWLGEVCREVAACRGQPAAAVAERTARNARELFGLAAAPAGYD
ncbi:MAG: TatD family hydrolase [Planctomycetes bacterium]|nr:TatD family hydrolase [Planctomycetota bacterium]